MYVPGFSVVLGFGGAMFVERTSLKGSRHVVAAWRKRSRLSNRHQRHHFYSRRIQTAGNYTNTTDTFEHNGDSCQYKHFIKEYKMCDMSALAYRSSSILKMVGQAPEKRKIKNFPAAYSLYHTPYLKTEFSQLTKRVLEENLPIVSNLRICKVILLGDVCVGKTCIVNRWVNPHNNYLKHLIINKLQVLSSSIWYKL